MASKSPVFPFPEPQHFSDYGFDPQIDYYQVLEEARKHKRESSRSVDAIHFKLQKPISKDVSNKTHIAKKRWWRNAILLFKRKWIHPQNDPVFTDGHDVHRSRARAFRAASLSGPVYTTESRTGSSTPCRSTTRPASGPLLGTLNDLQIPYLSLRELNMEQQQYRNSTSAATPIYLVT